MNHDCDEGRGDPEVHERIDAKFEEDYSTEFDVLGLVRIVALQMDFYEDQ